tara:strand:- start:435 stop:1145 length:711 start_codon:yes stop_codon:yes gene_type:complete
MGLSLGLGVTSSSYVDSVWNPSVLSSLIHWYRLGVGQTESGGQLSQWNDQKGSNHLTGAGGAANQPVVSSGAVVFNANDDHLEFTSSLQLGTFSIYIRALHTNVDAGDFILCQSDNGGTDFFKLHEEDLPRVKINGSRHNYAFDSSASISNNTKYSLGFERASNDAISIFAEQSGSNLTASVDGTLGDGTEAVSAKTDFVEVGRPSKDLTIYEMVVLNDSLSSDNRALLLNYLSNI